MMGVTVLVQKVLDSLSLPVIVNGHEIKASASIGISLYSPGLDTEELVERAEKTLLDIGSGAGFPGFVLAAARPALDVWLVESRQRKWAFLRAAAARAALPCHCLDARVSASLPPEVPEELEFVTLRAVNLPPATQAALLERLSPEGTMLWWRGAEAVDLPAGWEVGRQIALRGSERRRIVEMRRAL